MKNMPKNFPIDKVNDFDFGDSDAARDNLLLNTYCETRFLKQAIKNKFSIIIGPRGVGKSGIFSLVTKKSIKLEKVKGKQDLIIGISDELRYVDIDNIVNKYFKTYNYSEEYKYSLIWDFYFVYRIAYELSGIPKFKLRKELNYLNRLFQHYKLEAGLGFTAFIEKIKDIKLKLSASFGEYIYTVESEISTNSEDIIDIPVFSMKETMNQILIASKKRVVLFIDKIDDFLVPAEECIQSKIIQGLIYSEDSYYSLSNIKFKILLRKDLYENTDISFIGLAKIRSRVINCTWTDTEILKFMAHRIANNLFRILKLSRLPINGRNFLKSNDINDFSPSKIHETNRYDKDEGRFESFNDIFFLEMIYKIFPREIKHKCKNGSIQYIPLLEFIKTHLVLANTGPNPRIILRFMELCISKAAEYYENNDIKNEKVMLDKNYHYPLIKRNVIQEAYQQLSDDIWEERIRDDRDRWCNELTRLKKGKGRKEKYTKLEIRKITHLPEEQIDNFIRYCTRTGCFESIRNDHYCLPILLKAYEY